MGGEERDLPEDKKCQHLNHLMFSGPKKEKAARETAMKFGNSCIVGCQRLYVSGGMEGKREIGRETEKEREREEGRGREREGGREKKEGREGGRERGREREREGEVLYTSTLRTAWRDHEAQPPVGPEPDSMTVPLISLDSSSCGKKGGVACNAYP